MKKESIIELIPASPPKSKSRILIVKTNKRKVATKLQKQIRLFFFICLVNFNLRPPRYVLEQVHFFVILSANI